MRPGVKLEMSVGTWMSMTPAQVFALTHNILEEGKWETVPENFPVRIDGGGKSYLGVYLPHNFFIGIEPDGYTHS